MISLKIEFSSETLVLQFCRLDDDIDHELPFSFSGWVFGTVTLRHKMDFEKTRASPHTQIFERKFRSRNCFQALCNVHHQKVLYL